VPEAVPAGAGHLVLDLRLACSSPWQRAAAPPPRRRPRTGGGGRHPCV
jgi:hypothetical protein